MLALARLLLPLAIAAAVYVLWPHPLNATFPCVELGRGRTPHWEPAWWAALIAVFGIVRQRPFVRTTLAWFQRLLATLACIGTAAWVLLPAKANIDALTPVSPGLTAMPVLGGGDAAWTRSTMTGNAVALLPVEVKQAWTLMNLAGGIHEAAAPSVVRPVLWAGMRGVAAAALIGRVVSLPLLGWSLLQVWRGKAENARWRSAESAFWRALAYGVPAANLVAIALATFTGLPDDADLRGRGALLALELLAAIGLVDVVGTRRT